MERHQVPFASQCEAMHADGRCMLGANHVNDHRFPATTRSVKESAIAELEAATIALRDAALAGKAAQARYQAALQAFNRAVAPDPDAK